jgi:CTP-dependent riboflavin kinase
LWFSCTVDRIGCRQRGLCLFYRLNFSILVLSVTQSAWSQNRAVPSVAQHAPAIKTTEGGTEVLGANNLEMTDAQILAAALTNEMGNSCVPDEGESPRVKYTLGKVKSISDSMIAEFTKMVQDELTEKRGPIKIGPPEIMNQVLASTGRIAAFSNYLDYRNNRPRGQPMAPRIAAREKFEQSFLSSSTKEGDTTREDLLRAAELGAELAPVLHKPLLYSTRGKSTPWKNNYLGVNPAVDRSRFFSSLEDVAPALPTMNKYLADEVEGLKRDTAMVNAFADGLALSVPTAIFTVAKQGLASAALKSAATAGTTTLTGAGTPPATGVPADSAAAVPVKVLLLTTILQTVRADLQKVATGISNTELRNKTKEIVGLVGPEGTIELNPVKATDAEKAANTAANAKIEDAVIASLPMRESEGGKRIDVPQVSDPKAFTHAIIAMREASKSYLHNPELLRNTAATNAQASSALNATLGTLADTRSSNDALMLNMQSFYNTSQRARADYVAMSKHLEDSKKAPVSRSEIEKLSNTLDSDINLMLEKMDDSASILSNQSEYFSKGLAAIDSACAEDAKKIYASWGKYRRVFRDKIGISPFSGPVSPAKAYLADAVLSRADCITKKSIARRMEMMRLGTVLTQFKSSCEDIKNWSAAGKAYKATRDQLLSKTKPTNTAPIMPDVTREVPQ